MKKNQTTTKLGLTPEQNLNEHNENLPHRNSYETKSIDGRADHEAPTDEAYDWHAMSKRISELEGKSNHAEPAQPVGRVALSKKEENLADRLLNSDSWKGRVGAKFADVQLSGAALDLVESKATMTTGAGFAPQVIRDRAVVPIISRPPQLLDVIKIEPTAQNSVKFMKQTVRTNAAAPKSEGSAFDEATITYAETTLDIRKIGVYLPVTEEQLEDEPGVRSLIQNDLALMVRQKLDDQITSGDGTGVNLLGILSAPGALTQALGTDEPFDALMKAMTNVRVQGGARPNLIVMHSTDLQRLALAKSTDGHYLFGSPSGNPVSRAWGVQIVTSEALPVGTAIVMDTDFVRLKMRKDLTIASSDSHSDFFVANKQAIRASVRAGLQILRDEAICLVTGLEAA